MAKVLPKRKSIRIPEFDYARNGVYFVTIDTYDKRLIFGNVVNGEMVLNDLGLIADNCWLAIPEHFQFVSLYDHSVMPNHVHGIIIIENKVESISGAACCAPTGGCKPNPAKGSLPVIVRSFKSGVTKALHDASLIKSDRVWQRGYYERVIRDYKELQAAINYIRCNPAIWAARRSSM